MKRLQAFKFQLRPGGQQECEMRREPPQVSW
ncbi:TPA: hypothetical protein ACHXH1_004360, partial [Shigella flexneri]